MHEVMSREIAPNYDNVIATSAFLAEDEPEKEAKVTLHAAIDGMQRLCCNWSTEDFGSEPGTLLRHCRPLLHRLLPRGLCRA